ncbi:4Fe-4S single cluster domain-containing protein [Lignipirellula cremea]|uniref:Anaerobic ribonucleotide reductase-activating protein n=1 Tax=Lignipirellula cremea TaxID=2528010 RepID=A0A518DSQ0_9BACT|nr:4Fe-4S single cluster domain-containing protein [Lignipirellula cremea]QDU94867.1 anaerobic ribonucleotide reductase-activating protein [Lignipirellula cremea]
MSAHNPHQPAISLEKLPWPRTFAYNRRYRPFSVSTAPIVLHNEIMTTPPLLPDDPLLPVAQLAPATAAEGPGIRFALWLQGCPLRCPGCCNPEMLPFTGGQPMRLHALLKQLDAAVERDHVEGVTLLGGEPFAHAEAAAPLAVAVRQRGLTLMIFSGYQFEELQASPDPHTQLLLAHTDLLVDGPYEKELPESSRRWIGSANQRIHFLSDRYQPDDPQWRQPNTLEIRLQGSEVTVNGFPAAQAVGMWKRLPVHRSTPDRTP